jgi:hypothetical protein
MNGKEEIPKGYYLNGPGRLNLPYLVVVYVSAGEHGKAANMYARFADDMEWSEYEEAFMGIKRKIAKWNHAHATGKVSMGRLRTAMDEEWIPMVEAFIKKYSAEMVPYDIRWAYNDVLTNRNREPKVWPNRVVIMEEDDEV